MFSKSRKRRDEPEVNSSSMADIAFLLLVFFLVATQIPVEDKGVRFLLPPKIDVPPKQLPEDELFKVIVNSTDQLFVEDKDLKITQLRSKAKAFLASKPKKGVISVRVDRGTTHKTSVKVLDELKAAYNELRAEYLGISVLEYLNLDPDDPIESRMIKKAKDAYPMKLSKAEPTNVQNW